jgi:hypothetical protein
VLAAVSRQIFQRPGAKLILELSMTDYEVKKR